MACWEGLEDPRRGNAGLHDFHEILVIAMCTVLCGGQGAGDMALFAKAKEPFLRSLLELNNGVPSHDTFSRLFRNLDPDQFCVSFQQFMAQFSAQSQGVFAIDGKILLRSFDRASGKSTLHMVSAWGCEQRLVLAQIATDAKSNEFTAVPKLLEMLTLKGAIVTADALNFQRSIAGPIIEQEGDHGRVETRTATVSTEIGWLQKQLRRLGWAAIGKVERIRETGEKSSAETAYYLLSTALSPERFNIELEVPFMGAPSIRRILLRREFKATRLWLRQLTLFLGECRVLCFQCLQSLGIVAGLRIFSRQKEGHLVQSGSFDPDSIYALRLALHRGGIDGEIDTGGELF